MHAALLTLGILLSQVPPVVLPCAPGDTTVACKCKQGTPAACAELAEVNPELLKGILRLAAMAQAAQESGKAGLKERAADVVDAGGCGSSQDPNDDDAKQKCTGQLHHISMTVWKPLEVHRLLRGHYTYRDPRFVARAKDRQAHCGWQDWHRAIDAEIEAWIKKFTQATPEEFEVFLRDVYARPELRARFPNGF